MRRSASEKGQSAFAAPLQLGTPVHVTANFCCGFVLGFIWGIAVTCSFGFFWILLN